VRDRYGLDLDCHDVQMEKLLWSVTRTLNQVVLEKDELVLENAALPTEVQDSSHQIERFAA
jgi:hypothetical protein